MNNLKKKSVYELTILFNPNVAPRLKSKNDLDLDLVSSYSGLSQQIKEYSLADDRIVPNSQPSVQPITPATKIQTKPSNAKKKKTK